MSGIFLNGKKRGKGRKSWLLVLFFFLFPNVRNNSHGINPLPDDQILDWSKLKEIADNILKCIQNEKKEPYSIENIVRKGEIAYYKQFLLFSQCFPQLYIFGA